MRNKKSPLNGGPCEFANRGYHNQEPAASSKSFDYRIRCGLGWLEDHTGKGPTRHAILVALGQTLIDYVANAERT